LILCQINVKYQPSTLERAQKIKAEHVSFPRTTISEEVRPRNVRLKSAVNQDILTLVQIQHRRGVWVYTAGPGENCSLLFALSYRRNRREKMGFCLHHSNIPK